MSFAQWLTEHIKQNKWKNFQPYFLSDVSWKNKYFEIKWVYSENKGQEGGREEKKERRREGKRERETSEWIKADTHPHDDGGHVCRIGKCALKKVHLLTECFTFT